MGFFRSSANLIRESNAVSKDGSNTPIFGGQVIWSSWWSSIVISLPGAEGQLGRAGARFGLIWTVETRTTPQGRRGMVVQEDWEVV